MVVGAMYVLLGMFCIQKVMERVRADEREKWTKYYDELHKLELEREEEEEREKLESGEMELETSDPFTINGCLRRCCRKRERWWKRSKRRRKRGMGGIFYQMGCRTVDWQC